MANDKQEQQEQQEQTVLINPQAQATNFQGYATKDGEVIKPAKAAAPAEDDDEPENPEIVDEADAEADADGLEKGEKDAPSRTKEAKAKPDKKAVTRRNKTQDRIDQAISRQRSAERRAELAEASLSSLEARLAKLESKGLTDGNVNDKSDDAAPKADDYEYGELDVKFIRDTARYEAKQEFAAQMAERDKGQTQQPSAEAAARANEALADFTAAGEDLYDDFNEVVVESAKAGDWPLSPSLGELIIGSEVGPQVAAWFGREEARLEGNKGRAGSQKGNSNAPSVPPPPAHRARGSGETNTAVPSDTSDFAAFEQMAMGKR
jgi:hypothetical protein